MKVRSEIVYIPIGKLRVSPWNVRKRDVEVGIKTLYESMKKYGFKPEHPLLVRWNEERGVYEVIEGQRRLRAAYLAKIWEIPCIIAEEITAGEAIAASLLENVLRRNLDPRDKAEAAKRLVDMYGGVSKAARETGIPKGTLLEWMRILVFEEEVRESIKPDTTVRHIRAVERLSKEFDLTPKEQKELFEILSEVPGKDVEAAVKKIPKDINKKEVPKVVKEIVEETRTIILTIPVSLFERIKKYAEENKVSIEDAILSALEKTFK